MQITETGIRNLVVLEPRVFPDTRGYFFESFNNKVLEESGLKYNFVQDNQSKSCYGVIRGLHFQASPHAQSKLVRVLAGEIYDVAVDIRKNSETYGKWFGLKLSAKNKKQLLIPKGFAHGFSVLSEEAVVMYKCDDYYAPGCEGGIIYNDPTLNIDWQIESGKEIISDKDQILPQIKDLSSPF